MASASNGGEGATGVEVTEFSDRQQIWDALRECEAILSEQRLGLELIATDAPLCGVLRALEAFVEAGPTAGRCTLEVGEERETGAALVEPIVTASGELLGRVLLWGANGHLSPSLTRRVAVGARLAGTAVERIRTEETRNLKIQSLMDHMMEGIIAVDEEQQILVVNPAAASLLSLTKAMDSLPLASVALPRPLKDSLARAFQQDQATPTIITFPCGSVTVQAHISPVLTPQGVFRGAIALLQDQTAQAQFRKLQESLVANVSHEVRGPLAALSAMVEALVDGVLPPGAQPRYFQAMLAEIARLRRLTYDLLELSRLDAGIVALSPISFGVDILLKGLVDRWLARCASAGLSLELVAPPLVAMGDPDRVEQVLTSFLDNAIRFTPRGGRVGLFARSEGKLVRLGVSDSGEGIEPEHLPYVWGRFYKADQVRTRTAESGTGLGLAIAKHWVEQMGGTVAVESTPGEGSRFSFTLPVALR